MTTQPPEQSPIRPGNNPDIPGRRGGQGTLARSCTCILRIPDRFNDNGILCPYNQDKVDSLFI